MEGTSAGQRRQCATHLQTQLAINEWCMRSKFCVHLSSETSETIRQSCQKALSPDATDSSRGSQARVESGRKVSSR